MTQVANLPLRAGNKVYLILTSDATWVWTQDELSEAVYNWAMASGIEGIAIAAEYHSMNDIRHIAYRHWRAYRANQGIIEIWEGRIETNGSENASNAARAGGHYRVPIPAKQNQKHPPF